eukprot:300241-Chlamydomonas_euryale.AAC.2
MAVYSGVNPVYACIGVRKTCVEAAGRGPSRLPRLGPAQGRNKADRLRPEAKTSAFCARTTLPRSNAKTGRPCIWHRHDLQSGTCMHVHQHACCITVVFKREARSMKYNAACAKI